MFDHLYTSSTVMLPPESIVPPDALSPADEPMAYGPCNGLQPSFQSTSTPDEIKPSVGKSRKDANHHFGRKSPTSTAGTARASMQGESKVSKAAGATTPRKRISRACDQCNQLRTKCDGEKPCAHCIGTPCPSLFDVSFPLSSIELTKPS